MGDSRRRSGTSRVMLAWLGGPVSLLAVLLLVVNDHVGKAAHPGLVTGKLSDLAGLVFAPALLAVVLAGLLPRLAPTPLAVTAVTTVGVVFTAVKATPVGAATASALWTALSGPSVVLADRTDLVALPALGVAWWTYTRARRRPVTRRAVRRFGVFVVLPGAVLAVAATSAPQYPSLEGAAVWRGSLVVGSANLYHGPADDPLDWRIGGPDGRDWRPMTPEEAEAAAPELLGASVRHQQICVPDQVAYCYRLVPGRLRVEESRDGGATWRTSWEVSEPHREWLARHYDGVRDPDVEVVSRALAVRRVGDGHVVVVANARDGIAVRDVTGTWSRVGFAPYSDEVVAPVPLPEPNRLPDGLLPEITIAVVLGCLAICLGCALLTRGEASSASWFVTTALLGLPFVAAGLGAYLLGDLLVLGTLALIPVGAFFLLVGIVGVVTEAARLWGVRRPLLIVLVGVLTAAGSLLPFAGWANGLTGHRGAALLGLLLALLGTALAGWLGHRAARPVSPDPAWPPVPPDPAWPPVPPGPVRPPVPPGPVRPPTSTG
ncbi:hypothetical protein [Plantactinospora sonchi]|uniref:Uncharacterized protein n=1 Tax=Plantactinospora sonchi TaxID=1544735 RepID=A0ABU7RMQ6_9ACTN